MTRYERIKAMTIEEMADWLIDMGCKSCIHFVDTNCNTSNCESGCKQWLEQEETENENTV